MTGAAAWPRRFYECVSVRPDADGFGVFLDDRAARTPAGRPLSTAARALAEAAAAEWSRAGDIICLADMPVTTLLMTSIDQGEERRQDWRDLVLNYLGTDLVCYRAPAPPTLVARQRAAWDPWLNAFEARFGVALAVTDGLRAAAQNDEARRAVGVALQALTDAELVAVKAATEISGSAVLALALHEDPSRGPRLFDASRTDEDFQVESWGKDAEAEARAVRLRRDFEAAAALLTLASDAGARA